MVLSGLATLVVGGFTLLLTIGMLISPTAEEDVAVLWGAVVVGWLLTVILALPIVLLTRGDAGEERPWPPDPSRPAPHGARIGRPTVRSVGPQGGREGSLAGDRLGGIRSGPVPGR